MGREFGVEFSRVHSINESVYLSAFNQLDDFVASGMGSLERANVIDIVKEDGVFVS